MVTAAPSKTVGGVAYTGQLYIFYGTANGLKNYDTTQANVTINGSAQGYFGIPIMAEDFNNDYQEFLYKVLVEETKIPEDFLTKFLFVIKKMLKEEIESLKDHDEEIVNSDETSSAINDLLGGSQESEQVVMADVNKVGQKTILEEENPILAKYEKALADVEQMISGVNAGDTEQIEAATNMIESIDVENLMNALEPIVILLLGGVIGGMVMAMYLPIFQMASQFIGE